VSRPRGAARRRSTSTERYRLPLAAYASSMRQTSFAAPAGWAGATPSNDAIVDETAAWPTVPYERYELGEEVGRGGLGRVVAARHVPLARTVAIKEPIARDLQHERRFVREARITAALQDHPGVLPVLEAGLWPSGRPFYTTRLVRGATLQQRLAAARTLAERLALLPHLIAVADTLAYAHERGIVHRDVKPSNVLVGAHGETVVIDWGLARCDRESDLDDPAVATDELAGELTRDGDVLGTPRYMAPEQALGETADPRADIYSLGVILYEVLAGCSPGTTELGAGEPTRTVPGDGVDDLALDLDRLAAQAPRELRSIAARALAFAPARRYPSARAFVGDLHRACDPWSQAVPPIRYVVAADGASIAYQSFGAQGRDLVVLLGWVTHLEIGWEDPRLAGFLRALGDRGRVIVLDKRGTGLSERETTGLCLDRRIADVLAVMDAAGSTRATVLAVSEAAAVGVALAAGHPDRIEGAVLYGGSPCSLARTDFPHGLPEAALDAIVRQIDGEWGQPIFLDQEAPSVSHEAGLREWWARYLRAGATPAVAAALLRSALRLDVRALLPAVRVPTVVVHRADDRMMPVEAGLALARGIPGARWIRCDGTDHLPWTGDQTPLLAAIDDALGRPIQVGVTPQLDFVAARIAADGTLDVGHFSAAERATHAAIECAAAGGRAVVAVRVGSASTAPAIAAATALQAGTVDLCPLTYAYLDDGAPSDRPGGVRWLFGDELVRLAT
jgi:pimeloyl-ACP methyl ester carboxylesterase